MFTKAISSISVDVPAFFGIDLATCHYNRRASDSYEQNDVDVAKPLNCLDLKPIELYWAYIKQRADGSSTDLKSFEKL